MAEYFSYKPISSNNKTITETSYKIKEKLYDFKHLLKFPENNLIETWTFKNFVKIHFEICSLSKCKHWKERKLKLFYYLTS